MPKQVNKAQKKTEIAGAALAAIAERGLDDVRMIDIARASGATTGKLVHYYEDKDAMLLAALEAIMGRLLARIESAPPAGGWSLEGLAGALPVDEVSRQDWRIWLQFWGRAMSNPSLGPRHEAFYREISARLTAQLLSSFSKERAAQVADALIAAIDGIGVRATLEPSAWPAERQIALLAVLIEPLLSGAAPAKKQRTRRKS